MSQITRPLAKILDVSEEKNTDLSHKLKKISKENKAVVLACIAPYVGKKVSPTRILRAEVSMSEEFGVETVINEIKQKTDATTLYLLLNSPGGFVTSSYKIARALRKNFKKIIVFVPHVAASGGTLLALTGNKIVMGMMSNLTPMDPTAYVGKRAISAKNVVDGFDTVTNYFSKINVNDAPYTYKVLAEKYDAMQLDEAISTLVLMQDYISEILRGSGKTKKKAEEIAKKLVRGFKDHSEVINIDKAKKIELNVVSKEKFPEEWNIMREWLSKYLLQSSDKHIIRYVISQDLIKSGPKKKAKAKVQPSPKNK